MAHRFVQVDMPLGSEMPTVQYVLATVVPQLVIAAWREVASLHVDTGAYLAALSAESAVRYPYGGDPLSTAVVNVSPYAEVLEYGHGGFHLPSTWRGHWRKSATGRLYAYVPFLHTSPVPQGKPATPARLRTAMPRSIYEMAKDLAGPRERLPPDLAYGRLSRPYNLYRMMYRQFPPELDSIGYTWRVGRYAGLFVGQMQVTEQVDRHAKYMTIRTITPQSQGWYIPPLPPHRFADRALDRVMPTITHMVQEAAQRDAITIIARGASDTE